ncbi:hypothetical protein ACLOJK_023938 [Asimina triloba]
MVNFKYTACVQLKVHHRSTEIRCSIFPMEPPSTHRRRVENQQIHADYLLHLARQISDLQTASSGPSLIQIYKQLLKMRKMELPKWCSSGAHEIMMHMRSSCTSIVHRTG